MRLSCAGLSRKIVETTGPLSDADVASLFGRNSVLRAAADALTGGRCPVGLPPNMGGNYSQPL